MRGIIRSVSSRNRGEIARVPHTTHGRARGGSRTRHADRRPVLLARNRIQRRLRAWLDRQGFIEVDPAALAVSPGNEAHLHAFATDAIGDDGQARRMYLHTSPEFAMKKLLAAGETRIAAFAHVWRNRERGALHSPEFTMLEWYRAGESYDVLMDDCAAMLRLAAEAAGSTQLRFRDATCDPFAEPERLSVAEAFGAARRHRPAGDGGTPDGSAGSRRAGRADDCGRAAPCRRRHLVRPAQPRAGRTRSSRIWVMAARRSSTAIPSPRRRWPAAPPTIRAWPSGSSFMPAAWNWPTALAN